LGLPTVQQVVEAYGGKTSLSSEWGKGVSITIRLPLGKEK